MTLKKKKTLMVPLIRKETQDESLLSGSQRSEEDSRPDRITGPCQQVVDARRPGRFGQLPRGKLRPLWPSSAVTGLGSSRSASDLVPDDLLTDLSLFGPIVQLHLSPTKLLHNAISNNNNNCCYFGAADSMPGTVLGTSHTLTGTSSHHFA